MTIDIRVSVAGNYKVPVTVQYGANGEATTEVISGRGSDGPFVKRISYYHGNNPDNIVQVTVGPESSDDGEEEAAPTGEAADEGPDGSDDNNEAEEA